MASQLGGGSFMQQSVGEKTKTGEPDSWKIAKDQAQKLGKLPSSFTTIIRMLVNEHTSNKGVMSPSMKYQVARLLRTPSFKSMLYYASKALHPEKVETQKSLSIGDMIAPFAPFDIASIVACYALYRKLDKTISPTNLERIQKPMSTQSQIGAQVGLAIPKIGVGIGLICGTFRLLGLAMMMEANPKGYDQYLAELKKSGALYDFDLETKIFGCSSGQIASMLISILGCGADIGEGALLGLNPRSDIKHLAKDSRNFQMKITALWIDTVLKGQKNPLQTIPGEYYPLEAAWNVLSERAPGILGGAPHWLGKGKKDTSPELTPQLFQGAVTAGKQELEIPPELAEIFSLDEICAMEEEEFDDLIDSLEPSPDPVKEAKKNIMSDQELNQMDELLA